VPPQELIAAEAVALRNRTLNRARVSAIEDAWHRAHQSIINGAS
jgi:hypothetical protein